MSRMYTEMRIRIDRLKLPLHVRRYPKNLETSTILLIIRGQLSANEKIIISGEKAAEYENIFSSNCKIQMGDRITNNFDM